MKPTQTARPRTRITASDLARGCTRVRDLATTALSTVRGGGESPDLKYRYKY